MKKQLLFFTLFLAGCSGPEQDSPSPSRKDPYTDTKFLKNYPAVKQHLCTHNEFCPVQFTTEDDITIRGLFRKNPKARATVICFAGFFPGRKEGLATFSSILSADEYNVLLVDVRGHGESEGSMWWEVARFGSHEYRDVIAALEFVHKETDKPIIIYGLCAGGFHAVNALGRLKQAYINHLDVRGLIFDSGWASVCDITPRVVHQDIPRLIPTLFLQWLVGGIFNLVYYGWLKAIYEQTDKRFNLHQIIDRIHIPVFYIHSESDQYSPIECCKRLYQKTKKKMQWIIKKARHAHIHLHHPKEFAQKVNLFLKRVLQRKVPTNLENM